MNHRTRRILGAAALLALVAGVSSSAYVASVSAQTPRPNPHEKGTTYYGLEAKTGRLTTRFADGRETIADRDNGGAVHTTLRDRSGNELARRQHGGALTLDQASRQSASRADADVVGL